MATPVLPHALEQLPSDSRTGRAGARRLGRFRSALLIGATAALTVSVLPGTASAVPDRATSPERAMRLVAEAEHELEVVTEELNHAKYVLEQQQAAVAAAERPQQRPRRGSTRWTARSGCWPEPPTPATASPSST